MKAVTSAAIAGLAAGVIGTLLILGGTSLPTSDAQRVVRDLGGVPTMTDAEAARHRASQYRELSSVADILALPTKFARTEALYALAGRSDSGTVQGFVYEANRIRNDRERREALRVLVERLAGLDPRSALAIARSDAFADGGEIEALIWRTWARNDLDTALAAVASETGGKRRQRAAQALFVAHGYLGNATTARIQDVLGIAPDDDTRSRYLYELANRSVGRAADYIAGLFSPRDRHRNVRWLAEYLVRRDAGEAAVYAESFADAALRDAFLDAVADARAVAEPQTLLEELLAEPPSPARRARIESALRTLVKHDLDAAIQYFGALRSSGERREYGGIIAGELVRRDPQRALAWARTADPTGESQLLSTVLANIAEFDVELAWSHLGRVENARVRNLAISRMASTIARSDPAGASSFVAQIRDEHGRTLAAGEFAREWLKADPGAAVDWLLSNASVDGIEVLDYVSMRVVNDDVDLAVQLLAEVPDAMAGRLRAQIARQLARQHSAADALAFIRRFEGTEAYDRLHAAVAGAVASYDIAAATRLADQLPAGPRRDAAYRQLISHHADTDPAQASQWLSAIGDERLRAHATSSYMLGWAQRDPEAATAWADRLPAGRQRDYAIRALAFRWANDELTAAQRRMIDSIDDESMRAMAWQSKIVTLARYDEPAARRLLKDVDIPDDSRQELLERLDLYGGY